MWNENDFCKRFKEKRNAIDFTEEWKAWQVEIKVSTVSGENEILVPPAKRICTEEGRESDDKWMDDMDYEIEKHKVGKLYGVWTCDVANYSCCRKNGNSNIPVGPPTKREVTTKS